MMKATTAAKMENRTDPVDTGEASLIHRATNGDLGAFETLYGRYVSRVYGLCFRMAGNPDLAEEITQDVFVRVWEKLHLFRGNNPFIPWLLAVAVNVARSHKRSNRRRSDRELSSESSRELEEVNNPVTGVQPENIDLEKAIGQLPEGARKVFVLHDVEGYRHEEIAGMMGITAGTARAQLHRARRILREALSL